MNVYPTISRGIGHRRREIPPTCNPTAHTPVIQAASKRSDEPAGEIAERISYSDADRRMSHRTDSHLVQQTDASAQQTDRNDTAQNHHRRKKNNVCPPRCLCVSIVVIGVLLLGASAAIPAILLTKTTGTTTRPSSTAVLRWNSTGITIAGGPGAVNGSKLNAPYGLAFDSSGELYVADYAHNRVLNIAEGAIVTVAGRADSVPGNGSNELNLPVHMLFDSNDNLYITDRGNNRVQFWNKGAMSGTTIAGVGGSSNISFSGPSSIRQGPDSGTLFISDTFNHRVISYPSGSVVAGGNGSGAGTTQLSYPFGLVYDSLSNSLIIPNYGFGTIVRWTLGYNQWTAMIGNASAPGGSGNTSALLNQPVGITMDPMGNIYVADSLNHRIQFFLAGQSTGTTIGGITGVSGLASNQLNTPYWVTLDSQLNMYVSDTYNSRVQKFLRY